MTSRLGRSIALPLAILVLAGCANSPLYNEARDKQGQALTKATAQVDLQQTIDQIDKRFIALRQIEAETLVARQATNRDLEIAMAVSVGADGKRSSEL